MSLSLHGAVANRTDRGWVMLSDADCTAFVSPITAPKGISIADPVWRGVRELTIDDLFLCISPLLCDKIKYYKVR